MDKRARILIVILSLAMLVSLTLACGLPGAPDVGAPVTEEETPAPAEETAAPAPTEGLCGDGVCTAPENAEVCPEDCAPEEQPFGVDVEALEDLDSYAYTFQLDGFSNLEGEMQDIVLDIEGRRQSRPTRAEHLSFHSVSEGEATTMQVIYIEEADKMWIQEEGGEWQEIPMAGEEMLSMFDTFTMFYWWDTLFVSDPDEAQYLGQEVVNGVRCDHYRPTEATGWGGLTVGCSFAEMQDDVWVAVDGNFPVKRQLHAAVECGDESGEIQLLMEVSNLNQPQNINPPM